MASPSFQFVQKFFQQFDLLCLEQNEWREQSAKGERGKKEWQLLSSERAMHVDPYSSAAQLALSNETASCSVTLLLSPLRCIPRPCLVVLLLVQFAR